MPEDIMLSGTVSDIIFENKDNGYSVFSLKDEKSGAETVCVGVAPKLYAEERIRVFGAWVTHQVYGRQLSVSFIEEIEPEGSGAMEKYLASGLIKGIGPKTAERIIKRFGEDSFYVIEEKPDRLVEIKGITYERALAISETFRSQRHMRRAMMFFQTYGITPAYVAKIYKRYGEKTIEVVKANPYRLADDVFGIGFKTADKLAAEVGVAFDSPYRIKAGIKYALGTAATSEGHTYLPENVLILKTSQLLSVSALPIENALSEMCIDREIRQENTNGEKVFFLDGYYNAEAFVARALLEISAHKINKANDDVKDEIERAERKTGAKLSEKQREAVKLAAASGVTVITGGPGTGKTTTINTIIKLFLDRGETVVLAAPTGRAAKRMTEATGIEAKTIHRLLGINFFKDDQGSRSEANDADEIDADVIIIDEMSMVDIMLMEKLLAALSPGTRLVLVGDSDQLPSVGAGNVLKDIIKSKVLPVIRLDEIFRQAAESSIILNAHKINRGEYPVLNETGKDFFFTKREYPEEVVSAVAGLVSKRIPSFLGCDSVNDIQVLVPMRKGVAGLYNLNRVLQETLNPPSPKKNEKESRDFVFREGDKVMQIKNNYQASWKIYSRTGRLTEEGSGVFNGDQGIIQKIDNDKETITVIFDDNKKIEYDYTAIDELELSYAVTIHKSQGSEYPAVVLPIHTGPPMLMSRNLLYTAVTRAKRLVVITGLKETIYKMVDNNKEINRYSGLARRLTQMKSLIREDEE